MIKKLFAFTLLLTLTTVSIMVPASAAPRQKTQPTYGIDISYPQCGRRVPTDQAFGIVGVNGGNPGNFNKCLRDQLIWASKSSGIVTEQAPVQVYINTSNPGDVQNQMTLTKWPTSTTGNNPYVSETMNCTTESESNQACSWQYGWERGYDAVKYYTEQAVDTAYPEAASIPWWLDVETANSWQGENDDPAEDADYYNNIAGLEGWTAYLRSAGVTKIGIYSNKELFRRITGNKIPVDSTLYTLPTWYPIGASNEASAANACSSQQPLTLGSTIIMTQYVSKNLDYNHSCPAAATPGIWNTPPA